MNQFNYQKLFLFPLEDNEAQKYFLVGGAIALAGFFIPILPFILLIGYAAQIARQVIRGEEPRMFTWEDWEKLFMDGLKLTVIRFVFILPILIVMLLLFFASMFPWFTLDANVVSSETTATFFSLFIVALIFLMTLILIATTFVLPAAEMRFIETGEFSAAFRFREWWAVFRANIGGFFIALVITYVVGLVIGLLTQILAVTLILACLLIAIIPASSFYTVLVPYIFAAQAYRDGKAKLSQNEDGSTVIFAQ